jgi:hypothetical protein
MDQVKRGRGRPPAGAALRPMITAKVAVGTKALLKRQMAALGLSMSRVIDLWADWARSRETNAG